MYQSRCEWREARSPTVIIACADGRWRDHIEDFAANGLHVDARTISSWCREAPSRSRSTI